MTDMTVHAIVLGLYLVFLLGLGVYFFKNSKSQSDYFIGGRNLNVWVTSMSAQASDMSGWLLMGLPGTAFLLSENSGMAGAVWTGIGLAVGTYLNWLFLAKRFRQYTEHADDSITIPSYLENRFKDKTNLIRLISAIFIVFFFLIYTAAQFSAGAKLFDVVFGLDYSTALFAGAFVIIAYTFLGGFLAVCWSDLIQGILMFFAIVILPIVAIFELGGVEMTFQTAASLVDGTKQLGVEEWFGFESMGLLGIVSTAAWGLGYFGQPHILARFMGIKKASDVKPARRIATVWVVITLTASIFLGVIGRAYMATTIGVDAAGQIDGERIFIYMVQHILSGPFFAIIAGILLTAILSAIMSTADSQLLVTSSAISEDIFKNVFKDRISDRQLIWISRASVLLVALVAVYIARDPDSSVFGLVSYAWAGFGAAFGPAILLSLYWKKMNWQGALAGILSGGITVLLWRNFIKEFFDLYELLPAFIVSVLAILIVSGITGHSNKEIQEGYDAFSQIAED